MNKVLAILFMGALFILTQSKIAPLASASTNNSLSTKVSTNLSHGEDESEVKTENKSNDNKKNHQDNDREDEDDGGNRVISIIPGSTPSGGIKYKFPDDVTPSPSPTVSPVPTNVVTPLPSTSVTPSPTPTPTLNLSADVPQSETASARFDLIKELEKLLSALKKIVFTTIS